MKQIVKVANSIDNIQDLNKSPDISEIGFFRYINY